jgi:hypothetical protein
MSEEEDIYARFEREFLEWGKIAQRRTPRRAELLAWMLNLREGRAIQGEVKDKEKESGEMSRRSNVDRYIEAAANGEASPGMVLELAASLMETKKKLAAAEGIIRGFVSASGMDHSVFIEAMSAAEKFVQGEGKKGKGGK